MLLFYLHNLDEVIWRVPLQLNPIGSIRFEIRFKPNSANRKIIFGTRIVQASGGYVNPMKRLLSADENGLPLPKRLSLTLKRPATHVQKPPQGFGPLTSEEDFRCDAKGVIPLYPKSSNKWAFYNLMKSRNSNRDEKYQRTFCLAQMLQAAMSLCARDAKTEWRTISTCHNLLSVYQREMQDNKLSFCHHFGFSSVVPTMFIQYESY